MALEDFVERADMPQETNDISTGALIGDDEDYVLKEGHDCVWVTVNNISVYIKRGDDGVIVDLYPLNNEMSETLATCAALYNDAMPEEQDQGASYDEDLPGSPNSAIDMGDY